VIQTVWFQHDRAHREECVRQWLDEIQPVRRVGRGGRLGRWMGRGGEKPERWMGRGGGSQEGGWGVG
jgi:hypothetical protein